MIQNADWRELGDAELSDRLFEVGFSSSLAKHWVERRHEPDIARALDTYFNPPPPNPRSEP